MIQAVAESLPMALGVAVSPLPIAAITMILMTPKARANALALLLGWIAGLWFVGVIVFLFPISQTEKGGPTAAAGYIRLLLGILFLYLAVRQWRNRPRPDESAEMPKILAGLDAFGFGKSFLTGFLLVAFHPKNLPLCVAGAAAIQLYTANLAMQFSAYLVFTLIGSSTVASPFITYLVFGDRANSLLRSFKDYLIRNNRMVLIVLLVIIGGLLLTRGLKILAG
jgi:hypothetical protein